MFHVQDAGNKTLPERMTETGLPTMPDNASA
jgi:hypothetical protein